MALWGGRFEGGPDPLFQELNDSLPFDVELGLDDVDGSIGWAGALHKAGVLSEAELTSLREALTAIRVELMKNPKLPLESKAEDIHSWVEARLVERVGQLGKKLHTGRSRNDQVATDLRMWTRRAIRSRLSELVAARRALLDFAEANMGVVMSGYTHLQRAQPVLVSHWALAYEAMLARDAERLRDAHARVNICPLGSGALAGTAYPIDREALAASLDFDAASTNSLDAVSDRDFALEALAALAILGIHLSRLGEDLVLYGSGEFGFFEYDDAFSSGSSLMPQKKNPDAAELLRGKAGRAIGNLVTLLTTLKGLPLAYNKDLQEDKEPLFDGMRHASLCLRATSRIFVGVKVRKDKCLAAAMGGHSNATDLADYLVAKGVPFRDAHEQVGRCVRAAIEAGTSLEAMPLAAIQVLAPVCGPDVFARLTIEAGMARRNVLGGTGPVAVMEALARAGTLLAREAAAG
jgi:argininosuccinate lyase